MPGDAFLHLSGAAGEEVRAFSEAEREHYFNLYGLDKPLTKQYLSYLTNLAQGDLGYSIYYNTTVSNIIMRRLPWTLFLVISAVILQTGIATILGVISAFYRDSWIDQLLYFKLILLSEIPDFILGLLILFVFAVIFALFPLAGGMSHFVTHNIQWDKIIDILHHAFLPIMTLTIAHLGGMYLLARNSVVGILEKKYLVTARAKGLSKIRIIFQHILRNAMLPIITRLFLSLGSLIGGAILVENVFNYPGLGLLMREAVRLHDYPLIQGIFLVVAVLVLAANLLADLIYKRIDPRIIEH